MEALAVRLLPLAAASGPQNMAADEVLLGSAAAGQPSLRFYTWSPATLSLGYFQPARVRQTNPALAALPYVRRPSGGGTLVHHHELTYALALPEPLVGGRGSAWLEHMHRTIVAALDRQGIGAALALATAPRSAAESALCFEQLTPGDVVCGRFKVVGSAQRKQRGALLQHGGILLRRSPHAPHLPGLFDLGGRALDNDQLARAISAEFATVTGWEVQPGAWTEAERRATEALACGKYCSGSWNDKR